MRDPEVEMREGSEGLRQTLHAGSGRHRAGGGGGGARQGCHGSVPDGRAFSSRGARAEAEGGRGAVREPGR